MGAKSMRDFATSRLASAKELSPKQIAAVSDGWDRLSGVERAELRRFGQGKFGTGPRNQILAERDCRRGNCAAVATIFH
jgi:hypothetical protein